MDNFLEWKSFDFRGKAVDLLDLFGDEPFVFLLESSLGDSSKGRYSFLGFDPFAVLKGDNKKEPMADLRKYFLQYGGADIQMQGKRLSPFQAGMMGYLSYEFGLSLENIRQDSSRCLSIPEYLFCFYDCVLSVDHFAGKLYVSSSGLPEKGKGLRRKRAQERMKNITKKLTDFKRGQRPFFYGGEKGRCPLLESPSLEGQEWQSNLTKAEYSAMVRRALEYIREGDIYQVNLAQQFSLSAGPISSVSLYRRLRQLSPSSFGGYFDCGDFQIVSSSPERFLCLKGNVVETCPMKGTRARGKDALEDLTNEKELLESSKEKAELLMITDLERNDLGRVCRHGSVKVRSMRALEKYATVFQTTSTIEGILQDNYDGFDLLSVSFPGGSITGCPKIRAMQIIEQLEATPRAIYTGSLGYMDFSGDMDFNILIRTLLVGDQKVSFHVGSGIVIDSDPEGEYQETLIKARAMQECLPVQVKTYA